MVLFAPAAAFPLLQFHAMPGSCVFLKESITRLAASMSVLIEFLVPALSLFPHKKLSQQGKEKSLQSQQRMLWRFIT
jgi:hypothetical protein